MNTKLLHMVTFTLVIIGALNWGLTALGYNLVNIIFGSMPTIEKIVYLAVGASAVYVIATHKSDCKICSKM